MCDFWDWWKKPFLNSNTECAGPLNNLHSDIIFWASDQISPPSHSLWAELYCQNPFLSLSFLFFSPFYILKGSTWEFPPDLPQPSHPCFPAPLHACPATDFYNSPANPRGSRTRRELGKVLFRSVNSRVGADVFWPPHTRWPTTVSVGQDRQWMKKNTWNGEGCLAQLKQSKLNQCKGASFHQYLLRNLRTNCTQNMERWFSSLVF